MRLIEDAAHAPYHSITLPKSFQLDSFNFEDDLDLNRIEDTNLKSYEEITLEGETLAHEEQYAAILIDEDQWNDVMEPDEDLEELIMKDKETASLVVEEMMERDEPPSAILTEEYVMISATSIRKTSFQRNSRWLPHRKRRIMRNPVITIHLHPIRFLSTNVNGCRDDFTPSTCYREGLGVEDTVLPDLHEFDSSARILMHDLSFLDQDDKTPIGEQVGTTEFDTLPARTRFINELMSSSAHSFHMFSQTVARFLQEKSPEPPSSENTGDISLNTILEGKNKKICARMFYETLVLENCGLVNVNQNVPYGNITLKVTSRLKEQLLS
ncbi:hypothetical protein H5410_064182 [Solanum commersonii]|uniref:Rad21/Rec8-like protein C-terminal eukaryotic domain-containing protein n=1 Tax=Solanum commersonii TaxID=4109 RepID=A0A9J5W089_SOLCO|nr:hypothetical protein H5410_064182 [Solanum commersonii]